MHDWVSMGSGTSLPTGDYWYENGSYTDFRITGLENETIVNLGTVLLETRLRLTDGWYEEEGYGTGQRTYSFTAPKDGEYRLGVGGAYTAPEHPISVDYKDGDGNVIESYTAVYDEENDSWSIPSYNSQLSSGQTVKVTVRYDNGEDDYCYYSVYARLYAYETLTASSACSGSAIAGETVVIQFEPEENGIYQFTINNTTPYEEDRDGWILASITTGEDYGDEAYAEPGDSGSMSVELQANRTYNIYINGGDSDSGYHAFSYEISASKTGEIEEVSESNQYK